MNILLLGSGGRECALAWKLAQSNKTRKLWIAPGNAGTEKYGQNIPVSETDFQAIKRHVLENDIHMVVVGPEAPLAAGITDFFQTDGLLDHVQVIGPSKKGAMLESSKDFAKKFMNRHGIPTARHKSFTKESIREAYNFLEELSAPYVLKADGLAAGKGVVIFQDLNEAKKGLHSMLIEEKFGLASKCVIIEEFLHGTELSVFVITDGENYVILPNAKDYKRIGEGDTGPNTGGMGSVSPVPFAGKSFMGKIEQRIIKPTLQGIEQEKIDFCGFIFFGLINCQGNPYVIEYNVRLGDPETEAILPRIESDIVELFEKAAEKKLENASVKISDDYSVAVMLVSGGYPEAYEKGKEISGLDHIDDGIVFFAGSKTDQQGNIKTSGGRVLAVNATGNTLNDAMKKAYAQAAKISFEGMYYRRDIGKELLNMETEF